MTIIYGVDTEKEVAPEMVRDALMECFYQAHCADTGMVTADAGMNNNDVSIQKDYCAELIKKAFKETGGDIDKPTKNEILSVMEYLKKFSINFRHPEIIAKHYQEIFSLVSLLK